jgi:hypothetical protein
MGSFESVVSMQLCRRLVSMKSMSGKPPSWAPNVPPEFLHVRERREGHIFKLKIPCQSSCGCSFINLGFVPGQRRCRCVALGTTRLPANCRSMAPIAMLMQANGKRSRFCAPGYSGLRRHPSLFSLFHALRASATGDRRLYDDNGSVGHEHALCQLVSAMHQSTKTDSPCCRPSLLRCLVRQVLATIC